jgi:anti-sigma factor RsiW
MKTLFDKLKASLDLDRGGKLQKPCKTAERLKESLRAMDHELRQSRTNTFVPTGLHTSIMRAVQKSRRESEPAPPGLLWRRLAATALVLAVGAGLFWSVNRPARNVEAGSPIVETAPSFAAAFDRGHELTQAVPEAVLGPLAGEMELLNRDFQKAMSFLAANMP